MFCCVVLRCVVLRCVVLCYVALRCVLLRCVVSCRIVSCVSVSLYIHLCMCILRFLCLEKTSEERFQPQMDMQTRLTTNGICKREKDETGVVLHIKILSNGKPFLVTPFI